MIANQQKSGRKKICDEALSADCGSGKLCRIREIDIRGHLSPTTERHDDLSFSWRLANRAPFFVPLVILPALYDISRIGPLIVRCSAPRGQRKDSFARLSFWGIREDFVSDRVHFDTPQLVILKKLRTVPVMAGCSHCQTKFFTPAELFDDALRAGEYLREKFYSHWLQSSDHHNQS